MNNKRNRAPLYFDVRWMALLRFNLDNLPQVEKRQVIFRNIGALSEPKHPSIIVNVAVNQNGVFLPV